MSLQRDRKHPRWRFVLAGGAVVAAIISISLWYLGVLNDNFRVVDRGKFYRSGQMSPRELRETVSAYGIRTIVNLRGMSVDPWHSQEVKAVSELGVRYVEIALSATSLPPPERAADLVRAFREGPYPMLIHCKGGADRTGLACAIYEMVVAHHSLDEALRAQLTWQCRHLPIGKWRAMDDFFDLYREMGRGKDLAQWIFDDYPAVYAKQNGVLPTSRGHF